MARARITARSATGKQVLASTNSDAQGRYQIHGLPPGAISLACSKAGYLTRRLGELADTAIVVNCSNPKDCAAVNFELVRAAVLSGHVVDEFDEPLQGIEVSLQAAGETGTPAELGRRHTDDRGVFRIAGVPAGKYELRAISSSAVYPHTLSYKSDSTVITVGESAIVGDLRLVMRGVGHFRVAGVVRGYDLAADQRASIQAIPIVENAFESGIATVKTTALGAGRKFAFSGLPQGRYLFRLSLPAKGILARSMDLEIIEVSRHLTGLILEPLRLGSVSGVLKTSPDVRPGPITLLLEPRGGGESRFLPAKPPEYEFGASDVAPGSYRLRLLSNHVYIEQAGDQERFSGGREVDIAADTETRLEVSVRSDFGKVYGRLKQPRESESSRIRVASHYRVALAGRSRVQSVQADQYGRFLFERIVPGDYRICAWYGKTKDAVRAEELWQGAGPAVRRFPLEPNTQIEIELTAAP